MNTYKTFTEAYMAILKDVLENPDYEIKGDKTRYNDDDTIEKIDYSFKILEPTIGVPETKSEKRNKIMEIYAKKEVELFDKGNIESMGEISKIWDIIKNPDGTINANYGYMVYHILDAGNDKFSKNKVSQWEWALTRLKEEQHTCQAILFFSRPKDQWSGNKDIPCTVFIQFIIRDNKLHLIGYMRSNDLVYGTPYNINYFTIFLHRMHAQLLPYYPNLKIGSYTHHATSLHIYKRNIDKVNEMLGL